MDWIAEIWVRQGGSNGYLEIWKWCAYLNTLKAILKVSETHPEKFNAKNSYCLFL